MKRAYRSVFRLVAAALMFLGVVELALEIAEWLRHRHDGTPVGVGPLVIGAALLAVGVILFAASSKLAARLSDEADE